MDIILLPVLKLDTSPADALGIMKASRRSAAVVVGSPPNGLITSLRVRKAKNQSLTNLRDAELERLTVIFDGEFTAEAYRALDLPDGSVADVLQHLQQTFPGMAHRQLQLPPDDQPKFEAILPPNESYGFVGYDRGAAVVLTQHETLAAAAAGPPPDCCCGNPATPHEYPAGQKRPGDECDNCNFKVEC